MDTFNIDAARLLADNGICHSESCSNCPLSLKGVCASVQQRLIKTYCSRYDDSDRVFMMLGLLSLLRVWPNSNYMMPPI